MMPLTIKREYLAMIRDGTKSLEIRVGYSKILSISTGDHRDKWRDYRLK